MRFLPAKIQILNHRRSYLWQLTREIQAYIESTFGFIPDTCWIAEVKELCHIPHLREAPNLFGEPVNPQPMHPPMAPYDDRNGNVSSSYVALQPGQTITLTFSGITAIPLADNDIGAISLILGNTYTFQLMGESFQTYTVTATS